MTHTKLKNKIIKKFGTVLNFCELAKLNYATTRRFLNRKPRRITDSEKTRIEALSTKCDETSNVDGVDKPLTDEDRLAIFLAIKQLYGSVKKFCEENPQYSYHLVNNIVSKNKNGNLKVARKTARIVGLMKTLEELAEKKINAKA